MELVLLAHQELKPLMMVKDVQVAVPMKNWPTVSVPARRDMLITRPEFVPFVTAFPMPSSSMDIAQFVLTTWSITATMDAAAQLVKFLREQSVQANVNLMSFWMLKETVTLVEIIKSSPVVSVSVPLVILLITVEFVSFHAPVEPSPSKVVVPYVLSTLSSRLKSEDVLVLTDTTRTTSEFVKKLS